MRKIKDYLIIILFNLIIFGFMICFFVFPKSDLSVAERRKLAEFPEISASSVFSQDFSEKAETYLLDHFPLRETFRRINAFVRTNIFAQSDVNGLWVENDIIYKAPDVFDEKQTNYGVKLINKITDTYFKNNNVYFSVIPDKNYYLDDNSSHPRFEYETQLSFLKENIENGTYIDLYGVLSAEAYYKTDSHWSQDKIFPVANALASAMGAGSILPEEEFVSHNLSPFYGVYYGQAALTSHPDTLTYLTSKYTDTAKVYGVDPQILKNDFGMEDTLVKEIYALDRFNSMDGYDIFLSGAQPFIVVETDAPTSRELILFRDSYGSSIAPLLTSVYSKITMIDLRYMPSVLIPKFAEINEDQDVLFLYSNQIYNKAMLLK